MANVDFSTGACQIELTHPETEDLVGVLTPIGGIGAVGGIAGLAGLISALFVKFGIAATLGATGPWIALAVATHFTWESIVIKNSDHGNGVWLYAPAEIWLNGGAGIVIPHTRTPTIRFDGHVDDGDMYSSKGDLVTWHIDRGVGAPNDCKFILVNECDWDKAYKLYIGQDTWWVQANGHQTAENGAWYHQLYQTQIVFHKPQVVGRWGPAGLTIADFSGVAGRDITTFRWVQDTGAHPPGG